MSDRLGATAVSPAVLFIVGAAPTLPLVRRFQFVSRIGHSMELHKKPLCIAVEPALADLIGLHLHERVVPALFLHGKIEGAEEPRVCPRPRRVGGAVERKSRKKFIRDTQNNRGSQLCPEEMLHVSTIPGLLRC